MKITGLLLLTSVVFATTQAEAAALIYSNSILPSGDAASLSWNAYGVAANGEWATAFNTPNTRSLVSEIRMAGAIDHGDNTFALNIYSSQDDHPGALISSVTVANELQCCRGSYGIRWISVTLSTPLLLEANERYWLGASTPSENDNLWYWLRATTNYSQAIASRNPLDSTSAWTGMQNEPPAVELYGQLLTVSEPKTLPLLVSGLLLGIVFGRLKMKSEFSG